MKEIRMHGRGGQGVVKGAQAIVMSVVDTGGYAHFIPFFGVERKGSPVYGFLRIAAEDIRLKCQVYTPDILMILDDTLLEMKQTFAGLVPGGTVIINTSQMVDSLPLPADIGTLALVDASKIAMTHLDRNIPNTAMLGAFAKITGLVDWPSLQNQIGLMFGKSNQTAAKEAYHAVQIIPVQEVGV